MAENADRLQVNLRIVNKLQILVLVYGLALIGGGAMGLKAGSSTSLIVGGTAGLLAVIAAVIAGKNPSLGYRLAGVVSLAMVILWTTRLIGAMQAGKSPGMAGGVLGLSLIVFVALGMAHMRAVKARKVNQ